MSDNKHSEFRQELEANLEKGPETIDFDSDPYDEVLEEAAEIELPYEEVIIDTESGHSFIYNQEEDEFEQISIEESQSYLKEFAMEYQDGWTETDLDQLIPGAEAYMFRI